MPLSPEQYEQRRHKLMASEVSAVLGVSPFGTPFSAWSAITEKVPRKVLDSLMHIRIGNKIEQVCAEFWEEETGRKLDPSTGTTFHPRYPWLGATRDRNSQRTEHFKRGPVECKSVSPLKGQAWRGDAAPLHVELQLHAQMIVPIDEQVDDVGEICALVGGYSIQIRRRYYDGALAKVILARCEQFWNEYVVKDIPPPLTDSDHDADTLKAMYPVDDQSTRDVPEELKISVVRLFECRQAQKRLEREEVGIANIIRQNLGTTRVWSFGGKPILSAGTDKRGIRSLRITEKNLGLALPPATPEEDEDA